MAGASTTGERATYPFSAFEWMLARRFLRAYGEEWNPVVADIARAVREDALVAIDNDMQPVAVGAW